MSAGHPVTAGGSGGLLVELDRTHGDAAPGAEVAVTVRVTNTDRVAVTPALLSSGLDGGSVEGGRELGRLGPGQTLDTVLTLRLPDDASAGERRVAVVAHDLSGRVGHGSAAFTIRTGSAAEVSVHLSPRELRGRLSDRVAVRLHQHGTEPVTLRLGGGGAGVKVRLRRREVTLHPGHQTVVRGRVRATRPALLRGRRQPFLVTAQGATTPAHASGSLEQRPLLPATVHCAVAVLVVLALWAGAAVAVVRSLEREEAAAPPSAGAPTGADGGAAAPGGAASGGDGGGGVVIAPTASISGTVDGAPTLAGIAITLERITLADTSDGRVGKVSAQSPLAGPAAVSTQRSATDEGGRFRFLDGLVVPGLYRVSAVKAGYEVASVVASLTTETPSADLVLSLVPATGRLGGTVTTADGTPLGGAVVTVTDGTVTYTARSSSAADGARWSIAGVRTPTSYVITATSPGYASASAVLDVGGGETRDDVRLALTPGLGTLRGSLTSRGEPAGGLSVRVQAVDGAVERTTTALTEGRLRGSYVIPSLPLGRYTITLSGDGWLTQTRQVNVDRGDVVVDLDDLRRSTATLQGRVLQEAVGRCEYPPPGPRPAGLTPQPCGNVGVTVANDTGAWRTTSANGTGEFRVSGVPAGTYTVRLERYGYVTATLAATVVAGDVVTLGSVRADGTADPIVLAVVPSPDGGTSAVRGVVRDEANPGEPLATLAGQVVGGGDVPLASARVFVTPDDQFRGLPPMPARPDGGWYECGYDVEGDGTVEAGVCVDTSAGGEFRFGRALFSGGYRVVAPVGAVESTPGRPEPPAATLDHEPRVRSVRLAPGQSLAVDLTVRRFGSVAGVVRAPDATGEGDVFVGGVTVTVALAGVPAGTVDRSRVTVGDGTNGLAVGRYRIDRMVTVDPPGGYTVTFDRDGYRSETISLPGGVGFNTELLRNVILTAEPLPLAGRVVWRDDPANPSDPNPVGGPGVTARVGGVVGYQLLDVPPYREPIRQSVTVPVAADGTFTTEGQLTIVAGRADVEITVPGFTPLRTAVAPSAAGPVELVLEPLARSLQGTVQLVPAVGTAEPVTAGSILGGLTVVITERGGGQTTTPVRADGTFTVPNLRPDLRPDAYTLEVSGPLVQATSFQRSLPVGVGTATTNLAVARRGRVIVAVTGAGGVPLTGMTVEVARPGTSGVLARSALTCVAPGEPGGVAGCPAGTAVLDDLDLATYTLRVRRAGFIPSAPVALDLAAQPVRAVPVGPVIAYGSLSAELRGKVDPADQASVPLAGARVVAEGRALGNRFELTTDATGKFLLSGDVPADDYEITIDAPGYEQLDPVPVFTVTNGVNLRPTAPIVAIAQRAVLRGTVTDGSTGQGFGGVVVRVVGGPETTTSAGGPGNPPVGSYELTGLLARSVTVEFVAADRPTLTRLLTLRPGDTSVLDVTLAPPTGSLFGIVEGRQLPGGPAAPLGGVTVTVDLPGVPPANDPSVVTGAGGNFTLEGLPVGDYTVTFAAVGYEPESRVVSVRARSSQFLTATLVAQPRTVQVRVRTSAAPNGGLAGVVVTATRSGGSATSAGVTDGAGDVLLTNLAPGDWVLSTSGATALADPHADLASQPLAVPVRTDADTGNLSATMTLDRYEGIVVTVEGRLHPSVAAVPLAGADVSATNGTATVPLAAVAGTPGTYRVRAPLAAGVWTISVSADGYVPPATAPTATVAVDDVATVPPVQLTAATRAQPLTIVSSQAGNPVLPGVAVTATRTGGGSVTGSTGPDGQLVLDLHPGSWSVTTTNATALADAHADLTPAAAIEVGLGGGALAPQTLVLDRHEGITVTLTRRDHPVAAPEPLVGATVTASNGGTTVTLAPVAGSPGQYRFVGPMAAATWALGVAMAHHGPLDTPVNLVVGADERVTGSGSVTASARSVQVTVRSDASGTPPLNGVTVRATLDADPTVVVEGTTAGGGLADLSLRPGSWTIASTNAGSLSPPHENESTPLVLPVGPATPATAVELGLPAVSGSVGRTLSVFTGGSTQDLEGATVRATRPGRPAVVTTSGEEGVFSLGLSGNQNWNVKAESAGHTDSATVQVRAGDPVGDLSLARRPRPLAGTVTQQGGGPVAGVRVSVRPWSGGAEVASATTGADGRYSITGLDPVVTYRVTFDASVDGVAVDQRRVAGSLRLERAATPGDYATQVTVDYTVPAATGGPRTLRVVPRAPDGTLLAGAQVVLDGGEPSVPRMSTVGADGHAEFGDVPVSLGTGRASTLAVTGEAGSVAGIAVVPGDPATPIADDVTADDVLLELPTP